MTSSNYHPNLSNLTPQQYWLLEHQITAFWHGFGVGNGLFITLDDLEKGRYSNGENWLRVRPERMLKSLTEYLGWLESYKKKWNQESSQADNERYKNGLQSFLWHERKPERLDIFRMISLLQNNDAEVKR